MYLNRTLCGVLDEMRQMYKTRNFSGLLGHIEEAQAMGSRMEAALEDVSDVKRLHSKRKALRKEIKKLEKKRTKLGGKKKEHPFSQFD